MAAKFIRTDGQQILSTADVAQQALVNLPAICRTTSIASSAPNFAGPPSVRAAFAIVEGFVQVLK
jgi:hypothetical protein